MRTENQSPPRILLEMQLDQYFYQFSVLCQGRSKKVRGKFLCQCNGCSMYLKARGAAYSLVIHISIYEFGHVLLFGLIDRAPVQGYAIL